MAGLLEGKVAIITGGGRGIGEQIAIAYGAEGAKVAIAARSTDALERVAANIRGKGGEAIAITSDISDTKSVEAMVKTTREKFGPIDILVNNSGIAGPTADIENITLEQWEETLRVNLTGPFLCCRAVIAEMKQRRRGRIINISSISGRRPLAQRTPYTSSKMGLVGLTRTLAAEVGRFNITVNAISPGATEGERIDSVIANVSKSTGQPAEEVRKSLTAAAALERFVSPKDIANAAVFLASDLAGSTTGEDFNASAGLYLY